MICFVATLWLALHPHALTAGIFSEVGHRGLHPLNLSPNGLTPKHIRHTWMLHGAERENVPCTRDGVTFTPAFGICHPTCVLHCSSKFHFPFLPTPFPHVLLFSSDFLFHFREPRWQKSCLPLPVPLVSHCLSNPFCVHVKTAIQLIPLVMVCTGRHIRHDHWGLFFCLVKGIKKIWDLTRPPAFQTVNFLFISN